MQYRTLNEATPSPDEPLSLFEDRQTISEEDDVESDDSPIYERNQHQFQPGEGELFGNFELFEVIGRGGMGVVYRAREIDLDRIVALKLLPGGRFASQAAIDRFKREAMAVAGLDHPNIVKIYQVGEHNGSHYISMTLIEGQSLASWIKKHGSYDPREAAKLIRQIADAIAFAHENGVIHRDLKPANILVDKDATPWVVDFGLAKRLNEDKHDALVTDSGQLLGTPAYLAPEQADKNTKKTSSAVDVYGLGATFYNLLTGNAPHGAVSILEIIDQVVKVEPVRPRAINPSVPVDLETICLKCLQKSPADRYKSARDVAIDCDRFLKGLPILAKRDPAAMVAWKFLRRNKAWVGLLLAACLGLVVMASGWWQARRNLADAKFSEAVSIISTNKVGRRYEALEAISVASHIQRSPELRDLAIAGLANVDLKVTKVLGANGKLCFALDGEFERYATSLVDGTIEIHDAKDDSLICVLPALGRLIQRLEFSSDGKFLAAAYHKPTNGPNENEQFRIWNVDTQQALTSIPKRILGVAWAFDNKRHRAVVGSRDGVIGFYDLTEDKLVLGLPPGPWMSNIALSPDCNSIAVSRDDPYRVEIIDAKTGKELRVLPHDAKVLSMAWKPNATQQLATTSERSVNLWDVEREKLSWSAESHDVNAAQLAFSKHGEFVVSADWDGKICLWQACDGSLILHTPGKLWIQFSNDGLQLAGASVDDQVGIWEFAYAPEAKVLRASAGRGPQSVDFSRCGRFFATSGYTGIKLWKTSEPTDPILNVSYSDHGNVRFTKDEMIVASATELKIWPIKVSDEQIELGEPETIAIAEPGNKGIMIDADQNGETIAMLNSESGIATVAPLYSQHSPVIFNDEGEIGSLALSPDGSLLATGTFDQRLHTLLWNAKTGEQIRQFETGDAHVDFTPDGKFLIVGSESEYEFIDLKTHRTTHRIKRVASLRGPMACCESSSVVAIVESHDAVALYNSDSGQLLSRLANPTSGVVCDMNFSPAGRYLAVATESRKVILWDLKRLRSGLASLELDWQTD